MFVGYEHVLGWQWARCETMTINRRKASYSYKALSLAEGKSARDPSDVTK